LFFVLLLMVIRIWLLGLFLMLYCLIVTGQNSTGNPLKLKVLTVKDCSVKLDNFTLLPHSLVITIGEDTLSQFVIDNHTIIFSDSICKSIINRSVAFRYRTFAFDIGKPFFMIDTSQLKYQERAIGEVFEYKPTDGKNALVDSKGLDYRGSFSRGISIGNSQSLVINSNFDMQLIGDLGSGLKVVAAISDENLPIQAQGNTQQLQEFDKVFIQVSKNKTSLTAGDYELRKPDSYFMNYFKKLKGITLASTYNVSDKTEAFSKGSFAISRGKFSRQSIPTKEGNQGPYRLQGNNGERFIIVLAGTERVFFNGILLTRGFDYDYVIDYNRAEIAFSPTRIIARDSRVIIDFEYTDINYLRSLYAAETSFKGERWKAGIQIYSEQDSKNVTGDQQLDSIDIRILESSGDDFAKSVRKSLRVVAPEEKTDLTRILYRGEADPIDPANLILYFTENLDSAKYTAVFSEVGVGKGDYVIDNTKNKNGRVYLYAGKGKGTYLPVIQLIPPEKKQLITANAAYKITNNTDVFAELALSNLDINRRSSLDNNDNTGLASNVRFSHSGRLDSAGIWNIKANLNHEYLHQHFNALNPYRPPEFSRDWNISLITSKAAENLLMSHVQLTGKSGLGLEYGYNRYEKGNLYAGTKHEGTLRYQGARFTARAFSNFLNSSSSFLDQATRFQRPNITASYKLFKNKSWTIGTEYDGESNTLKGFRTDTLKKASYAYNFLKGYIASDISKDFSIKVAYSSRNDYFAKTDQLQKASNAKELELAGKWLASAASDLSWSITGRDLSITDQGLLPNDKSKKTILGRLDYVFAAINQGIRSTTTYNTSSGQEPRIEYIFRKVENGQGDFFLINESENPNLSNVQDFRYDPTNPLSNYIRLSLTNNEFIRTNNLELNQSLTIDPSKFKTLKEGVKLSKTYKFLSRFSSLSNFRITKKQMDNIASPLTSYIDFSIRDTSLVAYNALNTNTIFFNKGNVKYDIQLGNRNNQNRIIQVSGREDRGLDELFLRTRFNLRNNTDFFLHIEKSYKTYQSEAFGDRNLKIDVIRIRPEVSIRPSQNMRVMAKYSFQKKNQTILTMDQANIHDITSEYTIRKANQYSLDMSLSYVSINFTGIANSPIEYDMLEGLKNGKNYLWNVVYTKRIAKNIDLTINYEGRKTGISPVVNVGRAQVKATF
jgi:hypothetical protein